MKIKKYLTYLAKKGSSPYTIYDAKRELKIFYNRIKKKKAKLITKKDIERYYSYLILKKKLKPGSLRRILSAIFGYFKYLKEEGHILLNPTEKIPFPRKEKESPLPSLPSYEEIERLLDIPDIARPTGVRDRTILELLYSTGMRLGELVRLDIYDVDIKRREVVIRYAKGGFWRMAPIGTEAARWLDEYIRNTRTLYISGSSERALFLSKYKERIKRVTLVYMMRFYRDKLKTSVPISCHKLRHACAVGMLRNGADIRLIQGLLGHKQITTTQVYTRLCPKDLSLMHQRYHPRKRMRV